MPQAEKRWINVNLQFSIGNPTSALTEVANVLDSFSGVLKWIFFIVLVIVIAKYIKKKNADSWTNKHS